MGADITDTTTADVLFQLNNRFAPCGPLEEMVAIQKEFGVFSERYSLKQAFRVLHIVPDNLTERRFWFVFLEALKNYISDQDGVSGHDRIVKAYQENLESAAPLPVHTTTHRLADDRRILVTRGNPIIYETQEYLTISIPTKPAAESSLGATRGGGGKASGIVKAAVAGRRSPRCAPARGGGAGCPRAGFPGVGWRGAGRDVPTSSRPTTRPSWPGTAPIRMASTGRAPPHNGCALFNF